MGTDPSPESRRDYFFHLCIVLVIIVSILFLVPPLVNPERKEREAWARALITQLDQAVKAYELDHDAYPPGDGQGSAGLRKCLALPGPKRLPYYESRVESFDASGNIGNPLDPRKFVQYRRPGVHNPKAFDLWCEDSKGRADGINNWQK